MSMLARQVRPALAVLVLAAGMALVTSTAQAQATEAEVRIAAQRLDDGQLEFALQQRSDGSWGERLQPERHNFPADTATGEWLDSSALAIDSVGQVRISARLGDDGRVEFTLQQQQADGSWGERLRPQRRFFPTGTEAGDWLATTPLTISAPAPPPMPEAAAEPETGDEAEAEVTVCVAAQEGGEPLVTSANGTPFENRSMNGRGNNLDHPTWGMAQTALLRLAPISYADGRSEPTSSRPNARAISNLVFAQEESVPNSAGASDITWQWGQFIDHDITLSLDEPAEPFPIPVPWGDPVFDPDRTGRALIHLDRSESDPETGSNRQNPRRQINALTAFIDGSQVYGSDAGRARILRANNGSGKLSTSHRGRFLPYNTGGLANEGGRDRTDLFVAGDVRVNEQIGLIAMHTLFAREHNRLAGILSAQDRTLRAGAVYQLARKMVGAQIQAITFNEFLPLLLGSDAIAPYSGYDPNINPTIASEFSAAAYRVGHTLLSPNLLLLGADGEQDRTSLARAFFNPSLVEEHGISPILRGLAAQPAQEVDSLVINEVRNMLLRGPEGPVFDLVALNIQRGRDHGLGDYNSVRRAYGLPPVESFADISSDRDVRRALRWAYGSVDRLDLWPAALAEDRLPQASVGETLQAIISDQFRRLRDGDRFWFENDPFFRANPELLDQIRRITLAKVIRCNTPIEGDIQDNAFMAQSPSPRSRRGTPTERGQEP